MFPRLPIDVADPVERLRAVAEEIRSLKEQGQPRAAWLAIQLAGRLPAPVNALLGRLVPSTPPVNTLCTNVPGPREARHLLGRRILEVHPIVPLFQGVGLEFAVMSYAGQLSISAAVDPRLVPDAADIPGHLQAAAEELHAALTAGQARESERTPGLTVADLMTRAVVTIAPGDTLARAYTLMRLRRIRHLPVVTGDRHLAGIVTHRDLLAASSSALNVPAEADRLRLLGLARAVDVMETHVSVAAPGDPAAVAGERMIRHKIGCLPVVGADGRLAGIVTEEDFVRWATAHMTPADAARQSGYPSRRSAGSSPERPSAQHPARTAEAVLESRDLGSDAPPAVPQVVPGARERAARGRHDPRAGDVRRRRGDRRPP
jgi:CBS domain-containing protein